MRNIRWNFPIFPVLILLVAVLTGCGDDSRDLDSPELTMESLFDQNANASGTNALYVVDGNLALNGTVEEGADVEIEVNGETYPASVGGNAWSFLLLNEYLEEEINTILVTAKDKAENQTSLTFNVIKDTTGPEITLDQFITPEPTGTQTLAGTVEAGSGVFVSLDGGPGEPAVVRGGGWSFNLLDLGPGAHSVTVFGVDVVGNESETPATANIDVDPAAVVITIDPVPATTDDTVFLSGTRTADAQLFFDPIDTGGDISEVDLSTPEGWTATFSDLDSGFNLLSIIAVDGPSEAEARILVHRDRTGPRVVANEPAHGATVPIGTPITITFDEDIDEDVLLDPEIQAIVMNDSADAEISGSISYNSATWTAVFTPDDALPSAETFTVTADSDIKDLLGNRLGSSYRWTFRTEGP